MSSATTIQITEALTFDDVSLKPAYSEVLPHEVSTVVELGRGVTLKVPVLSAAMDTVTEAETAIAMAQHGGLGVIHKNLTPAEQASLVRKVKKHETHMVSDPVTLPPDAAISEAFDLMEQHGVSGFPVVDDGGRPVGIVTMRDLRLVQEKSAPVSQFMSTEVVKARRGISREAALALLHEHRIEKLLIEEDDGKLAGLITIRDLQRSTRTPNAARDADGRLVAAAAIGPGADLAARVEALAEAGLNVFVVDTAHGHSKGVLDAVKYVREVAPDAAIVGGNIATGEAAEALADAGADCVKIGIGPGSICTTRMVAGVGVPQISAIAETSAAARSRGLTSIADGGIKYSGDCVKALAAGADMIMVGSLLAGTEEAPGELVLYQGRSFKVYRGMGSLGAMERGSADRYGQGSVREVRKLVPEGVEGRVPYRGPLADILYQLVGGIRSGMGYLGAPTLAAMRERARFVRLTGAGLRESHVHDVDITREAPNYRT
jgi:IMP dehydrogenase